MEHHSGYVVAKREWGPRQIKRIWTEEAKPCQNHPYLERMGISEPGNVRVVGDTLLVPMYAFGKGLVNIQLVQPDGHVDYVRNAQLRGASHPFGLTVSDPTIYICEGWANAWTIHHATNSAVFAVFSRSELLTVATEVRRVHPSARIIVGALNDRWSYAERDGQKLPNAGVVAAFEGAERVGGQLVVPDFQDLDGRPAGFNDLRQREGRDSVIRWLDPRHVAYATDRLEGHDVLETACRARIPDADTGGQPMRVGEVLCRVINGFSDTAESGSRDLLSASSLLRSVGLMVIGDSLLVANQGSWLHQRLENRWPDRQWMSLLRELPDARPTPPKYFVGGLTSRATSVPLSLFPLW